MYVWRTQGLNVLALTLILWSIQTYIMYVWRIEIMYLIGIQGNLDRVFQHLVEMK